jgi:hypothetical protein
MRHTRLRKWQLSFLCGRLVVSVRSPSHARLLSSQEKKVSPQKQSPDGHRVLGEYTQHSLVEPLPPINRCSRRWRGSGCSPRRASLSPHSLQILKQGWALCNSNFSGKLGGDDVAKEERKCPGMSEKSTGTKEQVHMCARGCQQMRW